MKIGFIKETGAFFKKLSTKDKLVVLACFVLFAVLAVSLIPSASPGKKVKETESFHTADEYRAYLEERLTVSLKSVSGVGNVDLLITLEGEMPRSVVYEQNKTNNSTSDPNGRETSSETVSQTVVYEKDSSGSTPYIAQDAYPSVAGVVVIAEGGDESNVRYYITEAVKTALNVPAHKIVVLPMKKSK